MSILTSVLIFLHVVPVCGSPHALSCSSISLKVDNACKPWLIETNHLPSFATDSPLDLEIKTAVIEQVLQIVRAKPSDKKKYDDDRKRDLGGRLYGTTTNTTSSSSSLATGAGGGVATVGAAVGNGNNNAATRPVVSPVETTRADASVAKAAVAAARARLEELYTAHAPEKLGSIDALLAKYVVGLKCVSFGVAKRSIRVVSRIADSKDKYNNLSPHV